MAKVTISPLTQPENSSFTTELNNAIQTLAAEFDKVTYRDGSYEFTDHINMNGKRIYNLSAPVLDHEPLRYADIPLIRGATGPEGPEGPEGPQGEVGPAPNVTIGTVTTVASGTPASASITGTSPNYTLNLTIPMGQTGSGGSVAWGGVTGTLANQTDLNTALGLKAPLASPALTGNPTAPTPATADNDTSIATTAYVKANLTSYATTASLSSYVTSAALTTALADYTTTASLTTLLAAKAALASPALTGTPTVGGLEIGFRDMPVSRTVSAAFALQSADRAKAVYYTGTGHTGTIDPQATTAIADGAVIIVINDGSGVVTIARGSGVSLKWVGNAMADANRSLAVGGMAILWHRTGDNWYIWGNGLT